MGNVSLLSFLIYTGIIKY